MMYLAIIMFLVCLGSIPNNEANNMNNFPYAKSQENFQRLFNALAENNYQNMGINRELLMKKPEQDQKAFDSIRKEMQIARQRKNHIGEDNFRSKRDKLAENAIAPQQNNEDEALLKNKDETLLNNEDDTLVQRCMSFEGFPGKSFWVLDDKEKGQILGCINKEYEQVSNYAKDRYCAMNLRSAIEGIRLRSVGFHTADEKRQNALNGEVGTFWKSRESNLHSVLINLGSIIKSVEDDPNNEICVEKAKKDFKTTMKRLHELNLFFPDEKFGFYNDALIKEIAFLNKKWDESSVWELWRKEHKDFWLRKSTVWQSVKDLNHPGDAINVQKLVKNVTVEKTSITVHTSAELAYLKAYVQANVEDLQLTKQGEMCLWVVTIHPTSFFSKVINEVSKNLEEWKTLDEAGRHLKFCAACGMFYNTLSVVDPHRDAPTLPSSCPVGSKDYKKFVKQISLASPELRAVGSALIKLTVQDELFEKTTVKPQ